MTKKYIDQYPDTKGNSTNFFTECPKCAGNEWKSAKLLHLDGKNELSKLCAPPTKPKKPRKPLPRLIRSLIGILLAVIFFCLGVYLLSNIRNVSDYIGIPIDNSFLITPFILVYGFFVVMFFYGLVVESLKIGFSKPNYEFLEKYKSHIAPSYQRRKELYPYLRVCMRCGHHYLGM